MSDTTVDMVLLTSLLFIAEMFLHLQVTTSQKNLLI